MNRNSVDDFLANSILRSMNGKKIQKQQRLQEIKKIREQEQEQKPQEPQELQRKDPQEQITENTCQCSEENKEGSEERKDIIVSTENSSDTDPSILELDVVKDEESFQEVIKKGVSMFIDIR